MWTLTMHTTMRRDDVLSMNRFGPHHLHSVNLRTTYQNLLAMCFFIQRHAEPHTCIMYMDRNQPRAVRS